MLVCLPLLTLAFVPVVSAQTPVNPNPGVSKWVQATFTIDQPDLRTMTLSGTLNMHQFDLGADLYTADDMRDAYRGANRFGRPEIGEALIASVEQNATTAVRDVLGDSFPTATITVQPAALDRATITSPSGGDAYNPVVTISFTASVVRTNADLGLGDLSDAAIGAAFAAGARVTTDLTLSAQAGYDNTYVIRAPASPAGLRFSAPSAGTLLDEGASFSVRVNNEAGADTLQQAVTLTVSDPAAVANAPTDDVVDTSIDLALGALAKGQKSVTLAATVSSQVASVDLAKAFPSGSPLPAKVRLDFLSADAVRDLYRTGAITDQHILDANGALSRSVRENLSSSLNADVSAKGGFLPADLALPAGRPYDGDPPLRAVIEATGAYTLPDGGENADLALRVGALVGFDLNLYQGKKDDATFILRAPPGTVFAKAEGEGAELSADKTTVTVFVPAKAEGGSVPLKLAIKDPTAALFTEEDASLGIVVDLKDLDIQLSKAVKGDLGNLLVDVTVEGKLGVLKIPEELKSSLPANVELSFLPADALRLLRERGLLSDENYTKLDQRLKDEVGQKLKDALGADVQVTGGLEAASFAPSLVGQTLSGANPVTFKMQASFTKSLSGAPSPEAAIALYTAPPQSFTLPRVQGMDTTYTVILPKGLTVKEFSAPGSESKTGTWSDGRDYFEVKPTGDEATATVSMAVTPGFVMAKFWPVVLLAVLVLVLIVGTPIAVVVLRRRGKKTDQKGKQG